MSEINNDLEIAEIYYPSGSVKFRYSRKASKDGSYWIRHGMFVAYHEDGNVASEGNYVEGLEQGIWTDFFPNGVIAAQGEYRDGEEFGTWRFWDDNGKEQFA